MELKGTVRSLVEIDSLDNRRAIPQALYVVHMDDHNRRKLGFPGNGLRAGRRDR